jgi:hypothetical protein
MMGEQLSAIDILIMMLERTGVVSMVSKTEVSRDGRTALVAMCRLNKGKKEKDFVTHVVKPARQASWGYEELWTLRTSKEYIDKDTDDGRKVVFAYTFEVFTTNPDASLSVLDEVLVEPAKPKAPKPSHLKGGTEKWTNYTTMLNFPEKEIERPLGAGPLPVDRNKPPTLKSKYPHLTGSNTRPGAGANEIEADPDVT